MKTKTVTPDNTQELEDTNKELAAFLGEDTSNLPSNVVETLEVEVVGSDKMNPKRPDEVDDEINQQMLTYVDEFAARIVKDPTDISLSSDVFKLGQISANMSIPHVGLYDTLIAGIMDDGQKGSDVVGSKDYNLLQLKKELDLVNPSVLSKTPIKKKFLIFFSKSELPGADKIIDMIYKRQETVKSTVGGIKVALLQNASDLDGQLADLMTVYKGLLQSHKMLKGEIYAGELLYDKVVDILATTTNEVAKKNVETILADITTQVNSLLVEANMNAQFFAGSQMTAKLVREQQNQIRTLVRQMEKAVLANLGLRVVAKSLEQSVNQSKALGSAIANTIADTARANADTSIKLQKARAEGYIDLDKLEEGVRLLEETFEREAKANELIIKQGLVVSKRVKEATARLEARVDMDRENSLGVSQYETLTDKRNDNDK